MTDNTDVTVNKRKNGYAYYHVADDPVIPCNRDRHVYRHDQPVCVGLDK
jgi:hypothetical protein